MKLNTSYLKQVLLGIALSAASIIIVTAGLAYLITTGIIGEGSAELWINVAVATGVVIGGLLSSSLFGVTVKCNIINLGLLIIVMLVFGLFLGGKTISVLPRIGAVIAGYLPVYLISQKRSRRKKRQKRQYHQTLYFSFKLILPLSKPIAALKIFNTEPGS